MTTTTEAPKPVTAPGGVLDEGPALRQKCAIFPDGRLLISRTHQMDSDVSGAIAMAKRMGIPIGAPQFVDLGRIREAYAGCDEKRAEADASRRPMHDIKMEVINLINQAVDKRATDMIVVVDAEGTSVKHRIDGDMSPPIVWSGASDFGHKLCRAAFLACAQNDANYDRTRCQSSALARDADGNSFSDMWPEGVQALRMHFNPVGPGGRGRNLALRILYDRGEVGEDFTGLGFDPVHETALETLMEDGHGLGFFSGPTGSGKTTALECLMRTIGECYPGENLMSVEDPPEFQMKHVIQLSVTNTKSESDRGEAFTEAIAGCMRSNPDRMMVGEVRTLASAQLLFQFALSGHPAYSTIHSNNALGIVTRLAEMGVAPYLLRDPSVIRFLQAQRLVRKLCPHCRVPAVEADLSPALVEHLVRLHPSAAPHLANPKGCPHCRSGYVGRTVVAEVVRPDEELLSRLVAGRRTEAESYWQGDLGGRPMAGHAMAKAAAGEIAVDLLRYDATRRMWDLRKVGRR